MPDPVIFFSHIPKTAGTTLHRAICMQYVADEILDIYKMESATADLLVRRLPARIRVILGHRRFQFRDLIPRENQVITVLREPVEATMSAYFYAAGLHTHHSYKDIQEGRLSLAQCAHQIRNRQTYYVAGFNHTESISDSMLLDTAKENLEHRFAAFGLTEDMPSTIAMFNQAVGWQIDSFVSANTNRRPSRREISAQDLAALEENLQLDFELYRFAHALFHERRRQITVPIPKEVRGYTLGMRLKSYLKASLRRTLSRAG